MEHFSRADPKHYSRALPRTSRPNDRGRALARLTSRHDGRGDDRLLERTFRHGRSRHAGDAGAPPILAEGPGFFPERLAPCSPSRTRRSGSSPRPRSKSRLRFAAINPEVAGRRPIRSELSESDRAGSHHGEIRAGYRASARAAVLKSMALGAGAGAGRGRAHFRVSLRGVSLSRRRAGADCILADDCGIPVSMGERYNRLET